MSTPILAASVYDHIRMGKKVEVGQFIDTGLEVAD